jgi:hypothetical protein
VSKQGFVVLVVVVLLVMFAPIVFADTVSQFFHGVAVMIHRWTS